MKKVLIISIAITLAFSTLLGGVAPVLGGNTLYGNDNSIMNGQANVLLGDKNTLLQSSGNLLNGGANFLGLSNLNQLYGNQNYLSNSQGNLVGGDRNIFLNSDQNVNLGGSNTFVNSNANFVAGGNNFVAGPGGNYIAGAGNNVVNIPVPQGIQPLPQLPFPQVPIVPVRPPIIDNCNFLHEGFVRIKSNNGQYLRLCTNCEGAYYPFNMGITTIDSKKDENTIWKIIRVGDKISLQANNDKYLTRCRACWKQSVTADAAFSYLDNNSFNESRWTPEKQSNGKWTFKSDIGKYLARCDRCAYTQDSIAFVINHSPDYP